jgi:hypothetical protein
MGLSGGFRQAHFLVFVEKKKFEKGVSTPKKI